MIGIRLAYTFLLHDAIALLGILVPREKPAVFALQINHAIRHTPGFHASTVYLARFRWRCHHQVSAKPR